MQIRGEEKPLSGKLESFHVFRGVFLEHSKTAEKSNVTGCINWNWMSEWIEMGKWMNGWEWVGGEERGEQYRFRRKAF